MDANVILYTIIWALLLIFIVWPLAFFCVSWYIFLMPFEALFLVLFNTDIVYTVDDFLERVTVWPRVVGKAIAEGSQTFPTPPSEGSSKERISTSGFDMKKILYSIAWLLLLIFIAMPLAYFLSWWWLLIMPFESMIEALVDVDNILEAFVTWPRTLMKATLVQYTHFPSPFDKGQTSHIGSDYHAHEGGHHNKHHEGAGHHEGHKHHEGHNHTTI